jgi:WD40 repeat protein
MDDTVRAVIQGEGEVLFYKRSGDAWRPAGSVGIAESADVIVVATSGDDIEDSVLLAVGYRDGSIGLWMQDGGNWRFVGTLVGHDAPVTALRFHPDKQYLGSADENGTVLVWNLQPEEWVPFACSRAGRGLEKDEIQRELERDRDVWKPICGE